MNTNNKLLSIYSFILALLSMTIVSRVSYLRWFEWQVIIEDLGTGYKIETFSNKVSTSKPLEDIDFPSYIAKVYSTKGECWWGNISLDISPSDHWREKWSLQIFQIGIYSSYVVGFLSIMNLVYHWLRKYFNIILLLAGASGVFLVLSHFLGPKISVDPDFSLMDYSCRFDLLLRASMISVNQFAIVLVALSILLGLASVYILIQLHLSQKRS
jgi:hypothetical protein